MRRFPPPPWSWPLWAPLAVVYRLLVWLRQLLYDMSLLRPFKADCPVISVGNLTVGGSGKTPLVEYLLRETQRAGREAVCLSRGYGGNTGAAISRIRADEGFPPDPMSLGDETAMLAGRNPGTPFYTARRRSEGARLAALWDSPDLILLDDGFQHLALHRDLNLLLIDAERGLGNGLTLPLGPLREPTRAALRADAILITKANLGDGEALRDRLRKTLGETIPLYLCEYLPARLSRLDGGAPGDAKVDRAPEAHRAPQALRGREVSLFCSIARPEGFVKAVEALGARVVRREFFPDHFRYDGGGLERLEAFITATFTTDTSAPKTSASPEGGEAPALLTTEKDAVKLKGRLAAPHRVWVLEMEVRPEPAARGFFFDFIQKAGIE